jgi:hypothetical protein
LSVYFALKVPKKPKSEMRKKLVSRLILDFELVFALLELRDWFHMVIMVLSRCFVLKIEF